MEVSTRTATYPKGGFTAASPRYPESTLAKPAIHKRADISILVAERQEAGTRGMETPAADSFRDYKLKVGGWSRDRWSCRYRNWQRLAKPSTLPCTIAFKVGRALRSGRSADESTCRVGQTVSASAKTVAFFSLAKVCMAESITTRRAWKMCLRPSVCSRMR